MLSEDMRRVSSKGLLPKGRRAALRLGFLLTTGALAVGFSQGRDVLILTSTNAQTNNLVVFRLNTGAPSLSMVSLTPTGGAGGAGGNAGAIQFLGNSGAVVNYGSNTVSELVRNGDSIRIARTVNLA